MNPTLHPYLQLDRSLVTIPRLESADYALWHPDLIHFVDGPWGGAGTAPAATATSTHPPARTQNMITRDNNKNPDPIPNISPKTPQTLSLYLPCYPLTQTHALFHQGHKNYGTYGYGYGGLRYVGNEFGVYIHLRNDSGTSGCGSGSGSGTGDESSHIGRAGVQDVNDAGGNDGLRTMGLLPWDEEEARTEAGREVLVMADGILFPDLYEYGRI